MNDFAQRFANDLRIAMYGDCDLAEQIKRLAATLAEYDGVPAIIGAIDNKLLHLLSEHKRFVDAYQRAVNALSFLDRG